MIGNGDRRDLYFRRSISLTRSGRPCPIIKCAPPDELPAVGSLMGFIGYDAVRLIEEIGPQSTRRSAHRPSGHPLALCHFRSSPAGHDSGGPGRGALRAGEEKIADTEALFQARRL